MSSPHRTPADDSKSEPERRAGEPSRARAPVPTRFGLPSPAFLQPGSPVGAGLGRASREMMGVWLGRRRYAPTYQLQLKLFEARKREEIGDLMLCLEHEPAITLGRGAKAEHLLDSRAALAARGIDVVDTDRGGEITLHAPGQLVGYPIVGLAPDRCDVRRYVRDLTATLRELIAPYGIDAGDMPGLIGVWADAAHPAAWPGASAARQPAKIGAIGVRLSRWVSMHGFALNISTDLSLYRSIVPCGVTAYGVCSMASLGVTPPEPVDLAPLAWINLALRLGRAPAHFLDGSDVPEAELGPWLMNLCTARHVTPGARLPPVQGPDGGGGRVDSTPLSRP